MQSSSWSGRGEYAFSIHAQQERLEEDLDVTEIEAALMQGEIVEAYPTGVGENTGRG